MKVTVRYFAVLRDRRGLDAETVECPEMTSSQFASYLIELHQLGLPPSLVRVAVNSSFVSDDHVLGDGDEVVLIPPVAGG
ncbi:MAG TPA: MoaD/ThiS family protein [Fimbriimonadaceae bacterium]|nr:MoaD/ThiS family protein [Fimbriimonadaceae bacterium]